MWTREAVSSGVGEPTACQFQGRYFQLSDVLGVDREMDFSLSTDKYNEVNAEHFILEDIKGKDALGNCALDNGVLGSSSLGEIDFGEGMSRIYAQGENYQILSMDGEYCQLVVNEYGEGRSVYFSGLPYSPQNCRILLRAIITRRHGRGNEEILCDQRGYGGDRFREDGKNRRD